MAPKKTILRKPAAKTKATPSSKKSPGKSNSAGMRSVTPQLTCDGAAEAIAFYKKAFGAVEVTRMPDAEGKLLHSVIHIGDSAVMVTDEFPKWESFGPKKLKGSSVTLHLIVDDVDAFVARAVKAGAKITMPIADMFWGDRYGIIEDPFGHPWSVATPVREVDPAEAAAAAKKM